MSRLRCMAGQVNPRLLIPVLVAVLAAPVAWLFTSFTLAGDISVQSSTASGPGCGGSSAGGTSVCVIQNCTSGTCEAGSVVQPATKPNAAIQLAASSHADGLYYMGDTLSLSITPDSGMVFTEGSARLILICDMIYPGQGEDGSDLIDPNVALPAFTYSFPIDEGTYTWSWSVDGEHKGTGATLALDTSGLDVGSHTIQCTISADIVPYSKDGITLSCGITSPSTTLTLNASLANPVSLVALDKDGIEETEKTLTLPATTSGHAILKIVGGGSLSSTLDISIEAGTGDASVYPLHALSDGDNLTITGISKGTCTLVAKQGEETVASLPIVVEDAPAFIAGVYSIGGQRVTGMEGIPIDIGGSAGGSTGTQSMSTSTTSGIQIQSTDIFPGDNNGQMDLNVAKGDDLIFHFRTHGSWWKSLLGFTFDVTWTGAQAIDGVLEEDGQKFKRASLTPSEASTYTVTATGTWNIFWFIPTISKQYTWNVNAVTLQIVQVDLQDGLDQEGQSKNNNFDIVDDTGTLLVAEGSPEWKPTSSQPTVYIMNSRPKAKVKFKATPAIPNQSLTADIYSTGDLAFTIDGEATSHSVALSFNADSEAEATFTSVSSVAADIRKKTYSCTWGTSTGDASTPATIYTLYGVPCDQDNDSTYAERPSLSHIDYIAGDNGWCVGKSIPLRDGDLSFIKAVSDGIQAESLFEIGGTKLYEDPWDILDDGNTGVCEAITPLMEAALAVLGFTHTMRKSVITPFQLKTTWFGENISVGVVSGFFMSSTGANLWFNESVCGATTWDGLYFYDVNLGVDGVGGWDTPDSYNSASNNLWYTPTVSGPTHGPVIHAVNWNVYAEIVGSGAPHDPYNAVDRVPKQQITITDLSFSTNGNFSFNIRTEGAAQGSTVDWAVYKGPKNGHNNIITNGTLQVSQQWNNTNPISVPVNEHQVYFVVCIMYDNTPAANTWGPTWYKSSNEITYQ